MFLVGGYMCFIGIVVIAIAISRFGPVLLSMYSDVALVGAALMVFPVGVWLCRKAVKTLRP